MPEGANMNLGKKIINFFSIALCFFLITGCSNLIQELNKKDTDPVVPVDPVEPEDDPEIYSSLVTINGELKIGCELSAVYEGDAGSSVTYQWYREKEKISGASKKTYTLGDEDFGKKVTVKVTGENAYSEGLS